MEVRYNSSVAMKVEERFIPNSVLTWKEKLYHLLWNTSEGTTFLE
jgi:hypothetical protein